MISGLQIAGTSDIIVRTKRYDIVAFLGILPFAVFYGDFCFRDGFGSIFRGGVAPAVGKRPELRSESGKTPMKIECNACHKIYNFKDDKLPLTAFTFRCKQCGESIQVSQKQLDEVDDPKAKAQKKPSKDKSRDVQPAEGAAAADSSEDSSLRQKLAGVDPKALKAPLEKGVSIVAGKVMGLVAKMLGKSEREIIFWLTQTLAYVCIAVLLLLAGMGAFTFLSIGKNSAISFQEIEKSLEAKEDPLVSIQDVVPGITIPQGVEKHFRGAHKKPLVEWLSGLNDAQRRDFIENLEIVIQKAQREDPARIQKYIDEYKNLKLQTIVDNPAEKYFAVILKAGLILCTVVVVTLIGLFSLLLVQIVVQKQQSVQS